MLKKDLVGLVARRTKHPERVVREVMSGIESVVLEAIASGRSVMLFGLGKLVTSARGPKRARDMVTGEPVIVPARRVPLLRPSDGLSAAANGNA